MLSKLRRLLIHFVGAGLAFAQLTWWTIRLMTPPPAPAPVSMPAVTAHDPDPVLLARAFGQVESAAPAALANVRVTGVYAGGPESAAVFVVEGRPAKAVRLGEEVAPGSTLVEVDSQSVTLDSAGVRRRLRLPSLPVALSGSSAPAQRTGAERRRDMTAALAMGNPGPVVPTAAIVLPRPVPTPAPPR